MTIAMLGGYIKRLEGLADRLEDERGFWQSRSLVYLRRAVELARGLMTANRPPGVDAAAWDARTDAMAGLVTALLASPAGLDLALGEASDAGEDGGGVRGAVGQLVAEADGTQQRQWLADWAEAGDNGHPFGKRTDERDERELSGPAPNYTALGFRLHRQVLNGTFDLPEDFYAWLALELGVGGAESLAAPAGAVPPAVFRGILAAWKEEFSVRIVDDYRAWMAFR